MSVIRVTSDDVQHTTVITTPRRYYASSSHGTTGSVLVRPRASSYEKSTDAFEDRHEDSSYDSLLRSTLSRAKYFRASSRNIFTTMQSYVSGVNVLSEKDDVVMDVTRFTPGTSFTEYFLRKGIVKDTLMRYYRTAYPQATWAYTNSNALNFFTAFSGSTQLVPTGSVLLYPNVVTSSAPEHVGYVSGSYCLSGAFTFDLHVNPRYEDDGIDAGHFKDGTILHLSSSYALSLVTGSHKDARGFPLGFRLKLQLSHSAGLAPSSTNPGSYPHDLTFLSDDNSLTRNRWHHVIVRWGTSLVDAGTGSFVIDGRRSGNFVIPSGTISPRPFVNSLNPDVLCLGNFYEGTNYGTSAQSIFFSPDNATRDGVDQLTSENSVEDPVNYRFNHPLKAELHDVLIRRHYLTDSEIVASGSTGHGRSVRDQMDFAFYVPPFFVQEGPILRWVGDRGGVLQTPFFEVDGTTDDPFNVAMSFGVGGHMINLENFVKDFSTGRFPRLFRLTGSTIDHTTDLLDANDVIYSDPGVVKRNLSILPCDDGTFDPCYELLDDENYTNKYVDAEGVTDLSLISLSSLLSTSSFQAGGIHAESPDDYVEFLYGPSPEKPGLEPGKSFLKYMSLLTASIGSDGQIDRGVQQGAPLTIYQRTQDSSSNQVTFFNVSNIFYGRRILPGSVVLRDSSMTGSSGVVSITLRDDAMGSLYRADSDTPHHIKNTVGNVFYDEGIIVVKSPHLNFFGKDGFELEFKGVQHINVTRYEIVAPSGMLNSSSNPTHPGWDLRPSSNPIDTEPFVYISGINLHDSNMNVVARVRLAQPVMKREGDRLLFRVAMDSLCRLAGDDEQSEDTIAAITSRPRPVSLAGIEAAGRNPTWITWTPIPGSSTGSTRPYPSSTCPTNERARFVAISRTSSSGTPTDPSR